MYLESPSVYEIIRQRQCQFCRHQGVALLRATVTRMETGRSQLVEFWACEECAAHLLRKRSIHDPAARHCLCRDCVAAEFEKWEKPLGGDA